MMNWFLSRVFPVKLGQLPVKWVGGLEQPEEKGECGQAKPKKYRDAIDRHWKEQHGLD